MSDQLKSDLFAALQQREQQAQQEIKALTLFGQAMHAPRDAQQLFVQFFDMVSLLMLVDAGFIARVLPDRSYLRTVFKIDKGIIYDTSEPWIPTPGGPVAAVLREHKAVVLRDLEADMEEQFPQANYQRSTFGSADISRSWMAVPLYMEQHIAGVVNVQSYQPGVYAEREARFLTTLVGMLGMGLMHIDFVERLTTVRNALSVPLIPLSERALLLPLVGQLDKDRIELIQSMLLKTVQGSRVRYVVISLLAMRTISIEAFRSIERMIRALELLGAQTILAGVTPELSLQAIQAGIDLSRITVAPNLQHILQTFPIL